MSQLPEHFSRDTFERLIGRALKLDDVRSDQISLAQAREIARELGISEAAWDAAIAERRQQRSSQPVHSIDSLTSIRSTAIAAVAFAAGALGGWLNGITNGDVDVAYGALLVLGGLELWSRARKVSARTAERCLDIWWLAIPAGMLVAFGGLRTDPVLFALGARVGTAAVTGLLPNVLQLLRGLRRSGSTSTA
jgi:hypothetical protein